MLCSKVGRFFSQEVSDRCIGISIFEYGQMEETVCGKIERKKRINFMNQ